MWKRDRKRNWIGAVSAAAGALALSARALAATDPPPELLQPIPEPTTILMVGMGLAGLAFLGRRRSQAA